jgi:ATP synthase protein I
MEPSKDQHGERQELTKSLERQTGRMKRAHKGQSGLLAQTRYLGSLGILLVMPVIGGAYLGQWLDSLAPGSPVSWTMSLIFVGVIVGGVSAYLFIRE